MELKTRTQKIVELLEGIGIDIYEIDIKDIESYDDLTEYLQDNGHFDEEIIYYQSAIEYLSEHDNSLRDSLELAYDMGYEAKGLTSEILASILASENKRQAYYELEDELTELFEE